MELMDIHCHILPGLDDGPQTMEEAVETMREYDRQGIHMVIATPHFHPERYVVKASQIYPAVEALQAECDRQGIQVKILPGQENLYYTGLIQNLENGEALTLAGTRYVLVEFDPECPYSHIKIGLQELLSNGYTPIVAHFERYHYLTGSDCRERLREWRAKGVLFQMNYDTVLIRDGLFRKNPWKKLLREGLVDVLASDCHGMYFRPLHVQPVMEVLENTLSEVEIMQCMAPQIV